jgi:hypothetical protein
MVVYQPRLRITMERLPPEMWLYRFQRHLRGVGSIYPLHRPRLGWREDANCCALSWSTERNPMTTSGVVLI